MPFNVVDGGGNHIGIIKKPFLDKRRVYLVAITDKRIDQLGLNIEKIKESLAAYYDAKNLFGKINEDKLTNKLEELLHDEYQFLRGMRQEDIMKYLALETSRPIAIDLKEEDLKGYILLDISKAKFRNGTFIIEDSFDYIEDETLKEQFPLYAKIVYYPIIKTDITGDGEAFFFGDMADWGGKSHAHFTTLVIQSGTYLDKIELPIYINAKKDTNIQLYFENNRIKRVFYSQAIYEF